MKSLFERLRTAEQNQEAPRDVSPEAAKAFRETPIFQLFSASKRKVSQPG
jgi:hypothetical protein